MTFDLKQRRAEEYEMQLYGFTSRAAAATFQRLIEERMETSCHKLHVSLAKLNNTNDGSKSTDEDENSLIKKYRSRLEPCIEWMRNCVQKSLRIPDNVLLEEDKKQRNNYSEDEFVKIKESLKCLQLQMKQAKLLHAALSDEVALIDEFEPRVTEVELVTDTIKNSLQLRSVDENAVQCVKECKNLEQSINLLETSDIANPYRSTLHNLGAKKFDPDTHL